MDSKPKLYDGTARGLVPGVNMMTRGQDMPLSAFPLCIACVCILGNRKSKMKYQNRKQNQNDSH